MVKIKKSWLKVVNPLLKKTKTDNTKLFTSFRKEVNVKKLKTINEQNNLWRKKYKKQFEALEKKHDKAYDKVWKKFHSKK